jgi:hypothetical protein
MPIYAVPIAVPTALVQNQVYGLPNPLLFIRSTLALESSVDGTTWAALTGADTTGVNTAARWIRCTTGAPTVNIKKAA